MAFRDLIPWTSRTRNAPSRFGGGESFASPMMALHREIDRAFDQFWNEFGRPIANRDGFGVATPAIDVRETDKALEVSAELPGLSDRDVELEISGDTLILRGEKTDEHKEERKGVFVSERAYGSFYRAVPLPPGIDTERAEANFDNGVLTVTLPKTDEAQQQVKRIEVKQAS